MAGVVPSLNWVIVGGESGPNARPMALPWARSLVEQCRAAGTPVFMKQIGAKPCRDSLDHPFRPVDRKGGDWSEWPGYLCVREMPARATLTLPSAAADDGGRGDG